MEIKDKIMKAYLFGETAHKGQIRKFSNLPYFTHPKGVARKAAMLTRDDDMIVAAFLHDVIEDCGVSIREIEDMFGARVASLVNEVTTDLWNREKISKEVMLSEKMLKMSDDALTLKLIDRFDNIHWLDKDCKTVEQKKFVKRYYLETVYIMKELNSKRKKKTSLHNSIIRMIEADLDFIRIAYLW